MLFCLQLQLQKTKYLQLGQNRGQYYGGSLPNVNQIGNSTIDVPFQVQDCLSFLCLSHLQLKYTWCRSIKSVVLTAKIYCVI